MLLKKLEEELVWPFDTKCMGDVSVVLGMQVTRDHEKGALTISQAHYTKPVCETYGMGGCKPVYTIGVGPELSITQGEGSTLTKADTQRCQSIVGSVMYLAQVSRYDIFYGVNQLARAMSNPSKSHMGAAKYLLRYVAGTIDFDTTCKQGGFKLTAFSDANRGNNPHKGKSTSSYVMMMCNGPVNFKLGVHGLTAQSTMEAELVAAALTLKEAINCASMMRELVFEETLKCVPIDIDNMSVLHMAGNKTYAEPACETRGSQALLRSRHHTGGPDTHSTPLS